MRASRRWSCATPRRGSETVRRPRGAARADRLAEAGCSEMCGASWCRSREGRPVLLVGLVGVDGRELSSDVRQEVEHFGGVRRSVQRMLSRTVEYCGGDGAQHRRVPVTFPFDLDAGGLGAIRGELVQVEG